VSEVRSSLAEEILARLAAAGFALAGICDAREIDRPGAFDAWLDAGHHGDMGYLAEHRRERMDPRVFVPGARSIICVADRYADGRPDRRGVRGGQGRIARYARGRDYHQVIRERLEPIAEELRDRFPGERFRVSVDTAPIAERDHAVRAGLGRIGKHTLLIGPRGTGSWLTLGEIVTTVELAPTASMAGDPCGSCTRCIDACPTRAIEPWRVLADRCISYLTIEHHGEPADWFRARADDWLFGCDACIEACPHSAWTLRARRSPVHPAYAPRTVSLDLAEVLAWTEDRMASLGLSPVLRRPSLDAWQRNALLLIGAVCDQARAVELLQRFLARTDISARVRDLARERLESVLDQRPGAGSAAG
jgi:epoxyqueuosine reductase